MEFAARLVDPSLAPDVFLPADVEADTRVNSMWYGTDETLAPFGLHRGLAVRHRDVAAVLEGRHRRSGVHVFPGGSAFELIFCAPRSLSFVWSQLSPRDRAEVEDAMLAGAVAMLDELIENHPLIDGIEPARSGVAALVLHAVGTRSATEGAIPPMLHVHSCLFAVAGPDGAFVLPDEATLYEEDTLRLCDALGEADLADRLVTLGYPVRNTAGGENNFEVSGVPQALLDDTDFWRNVGCAVANPQ
jgi:hypothetical protein